MFLTSRLTINKKKVMKNNLNLLSLSIIIGLGFGAYVPPGKLMYIFFNILRAIS